MYSCLLPSSAGEWHFTPDKGVFKDHPVFSFHLEGLQRWPKQLDWRQYDRTMPYKAFKYWYGTIFYTILFLQYSVLENCTHLCCIQQYWLDSYQQNPSAGHWTINIGHDCFHSCLVHHSCDVCWEAHLRVNQNSKIFHCWPYLHHLISDPYWDSSERESSSLSRPWHLLKANISLYETYSQLLIILIILFSLIWIRSTVQVVTSYAMSSVKHSRQAWLLRHLQPQQASRGLVEGWSTKPWPSLLSAAVLPVFRTAVFCF